MEASGDPSHALGLRNLNLIVLVPLVLIRARIVIRHYLRDITAHTGWSGCVLVVETTTLQPVVINNTNP